MDAVQLFRERHDGFREYPERLVDGLTEEQLRLSPRPPLNPIVWTLWHIARCEDVGVHRLLGGGPQELDAGGWEERLRSRERSIGTGMSKADALRLAETVDLDALQAYRRVVADRTAAFVRALDPAGLSDPLEPALLNRVFREEGAGGPAADGLVAAYTDRTRGWMLGHLGLTHSYYHVGQAFGVRALWGAANPW